MTTEIGISPDGTPYISFTHMTQSEATLVEFFRVRLGIEHGPDGYYRIPARGNTPEACTP